MNCFRCRVHEHSNEMDVIKLVCCERWMLAAPWRAYLCMYMYHIYVRWFLCHLFSHLLLSLSFVVTFIPTYVGFYCCSFWNWNLVPDGLNVLGVRNGEHVIEWRNGWARSCVCPCEYFCSFIVRYSMFWFTADIIDLSTEWIYSPNTLSHSITHSHILSSTYSIHAAPYVDER